LTGCVVPKTHYEEALSAVRVENAAHRRTQARLFDAERRIGAAEGAILERDRRIQLLEQQIAQSMLDFTLAAGERDRASQLVEQLRTELGRVALHLEQYAEEKTALAAALRSAEDRAERLAEIEREAARRARLVRDVTLVLRGPIERGDGELAVEEGRPVVRLAEASVFAGDLVAPEARELLGRLARAVGHVASARIELGQKGGRHAPDALVLRLGRVADALTEQGIRADRIQVSLPAGTERTAVVATSDGAPESLSPEPLAAEPGQVEIAIVTSED
jgi:hypothetical protein